MDNSNFLKFDETETVFDETKIVLRHCDEEATGEIIIPNGVTEIKNGAFYGCTGLTEINVEPTNKHYTSVDGVLYNKDKSEIIRYPSSHQGETFIIPNSVTEIGHSAFEGCTGLTSIEIPDSVTKIEDYAFGVCTGLTEIEIPDSVTSIRDCAFKGCKGLTSIEIPDSVTKIGWGAFEGCTGLKSIVIPDSVTSIRDSAFKGCKGLTSIEIPDSVTRIGWSAFEGCTGLTEINVDAKNEHYTSVDGILYNKDKSKIIRYPSSHQGDSFIIPNSVTKIEELAFSGCTGLTSIVIPNSVTKIESGAFYNCKRLTSIEIPDSATRIGWSAFYGCTGLTEINVNAKNEHYTSVDGILYNKDKSEIICYPISHQGETFIIPDYVTEIGWGAFKGCTGLTEIYIPDSVTEIGYWAFYGCTGLTSIEIPDSVTEIGEGAFLGCTGLPVENNIRYADIYLIEAVDKSLPTYSIKEGTKWIGHRAFADCTELTSIEIPNSVTEFGWYAFEGCTGITEIRIGNIVNKLEFKDHFRDCINLTSIKILNGITEIGDGAFYGCTGLTEIYIPNSVTEIGDGAFYGCTGLREIHIRLRDISTITGESIFDDVCKEQCTLYVPIGKGYAYRHHPAFKDFPNIVLER